MGHNEEVIDLMNENTRNESALEDSKKAHASTAQKLSEANQNNNKLQEALSKLRSEYEALNAEHIRLDDLWDKTSLENTKLKAEVAFLLFPVELMSVGTRLRAITDIETENTKLKEEVRQKELARLHETEVLGDKLNDYIDRTKDLQTQLNAANKRFEDKETIDLLILEADGWLSPNLSKQMKDKLDAANKQLEKYRELVAYIPHSDYCGFHVPGLRTQGNCDCLLKSLRELKEVKDG